jgi:hypothetical protein
MEPREWRRWRGIARLGSYLLAPAALVLVPTAWIERGPPLCLSRALLGARCPGCGMTRAVSCAAHGRLRRAWAHNRLVIVVGPLLAWEWARGLRRAWREMAQDG